ncbi:MAG: dihydropteroate synthase [Halodesulfurarchaeum sp.]|nr:dihydropteroate synthase [Halodesulfurarchaeum sp.]
MTVVTEVEGTEETVRIDRTEQVRIIGERINPRPESDLAVALQNEDMEPVRELALEQVENGADLIDVNVDADGIDKETVLPMAVETVADAVDVPIVIDTNYDDADALEAALEVVPGRPIVNSVSMEGPSLETIFPLVAEYDTAVVGLTMDESGPPGSAEGRIELAEALLEQADEYGVDREDVILDPLAYPLSTDSDAGLDVLTAMETIREEFGNNITLGLSNISYEMPERDRINNLYLAMAIEAGLNVPILNPGETRETVLIADLVMGRDDYAKRFLGHIRSR